MTTTLYENWRRAQGTSDLMPPCEEYVDARSLAANVAEVITVPTGYKYVTFNATGNVEFWVKWNDAATIPADVTDGTAAVLSPAGRELVIGQARAAVTTIGIIAATAIIVSISWWK